jgi:membrane associated rhomboid family serine protease
MLPLKDDVPSRSFPVVTVWLIAMNVIVYAYEFFLSFPADPTLAASRSAAARAFQGFVLEFGLVPCRLAASCPPKLFTQLAGAPSPWITVFTSMFVHGGLLHVGGNMLYLWIFGNNVEDATGRSRFLGFYLLCGVVAAGAQWLQNPSSTVPMVGASGAVSGTLGAYLLLHPHARVWTLIVFGFFWRIVPVPAVIVLGFWIVVQAVNSVLTFGRGEGGGVAFLAHVGGFVAGLVLIGVFRRRPRGWAARS